MGSAFGAAFKMTRKAWPPGQTSVKTRFAVKCSTTPAPGVLIGLESDAARPDSLGVEQLSR